MGQNQNRGSVKGDWVYCDRPDGRFEARWWWVDGETLVEVQFRPRTKNGRLSTRAMEAAGVFPAELLAEVVQAWVVDRVLGRAEGGPR